jgi:plasmid stabilization system protein ParE
MSHINPGTDTTINPVVIDDSKRSKKKTPFDDIVYSSTPWKIYRQDAGMGEHDYAVFLNDVFFCRTEYSQTANEIINAIRHHTSAPAHPSEAQQRVDAAIKELERLAAEKDQLKKESKTNEPWMGHAYAASAYMKAIALLQAGRK